MTNPVVLAILAATALMTTTPDVGPVEPATDPPAVPVDVPASDTGVPLAACLVCGGIQILPRRPAPITWGPWRKGLPRFRCTDCRTIYVVRGVLSGSGVELVAQRTRASRSL